MKYINIGTVQNQYKCINYNITNNNLCFDKKDFLSITPIDSTSLTITISNSSSNVIKYSYDASISVSSWTSLTTLQNVNKTIYLYGNNNTLSAPSSGGIINVTGGKFIIGGNPKSLINPSSTNYNYKCLFRGNSNLIRANDMLIQDSTLYNYMYESMFENCTNLIIGPNYKYSSLPILGASANISNIFCKTFKNCTALKYASIIDIVVNYLNGSNFPSYSSLYANTFEGCTNLFYTVKGIGSRLLSCNKLFYNMFKNCSNLKIAPKIKTRFIVYNDSSFEYTDKYSNMLVSTFDGCTSLNSVYLYINDIYQNCNLLSNKAQQSIDYIYNNTFSNLLNNTKNNIKLHLPFGIISYFGGYLGSTDTPGQYYNIINDIHYDEYLHISKSSLQDQPNYVSFRLNLIDGDEFTNKYYIAYSTNNGLTWKYMYSQIYDIYEYGSISNHENIIKSNDFYKHIYIKSNNKNFAPYNLITYYDSNNNAYRAPCYIGGNMLSLVYGDKFENKENKNIYYTYSDSYMDEMFIGYLFGAENKHIYDYYLYYHDTANLYSTKYCGIKLHQFKGAQISYTNNLFYNNPEQINNFNANGSIVTYDNIYRYQKDAMNVPALTSYINNVIYSTYLTTGYVNMYFSTAEAANKSAVFFVHPESKYIDNNKYYKIPAGAIPYSNVKYIYKIEKDYEDDNYEQL